MGPTTEEAPTATPPIIRKIIKSVQVGVIEQPIADNKYMSAITNNTFLRPYRCAGFPAIMDPITVPIRLAATVNPKRKSLSDQSCWIVFSAPEITAVSNPNKNPPSAAISVQRSRKELIFIQQSLRGYKV